MKTTPTPPSEGVSNEATALADIVKWSKGCPAWQRDALRRLCLQGHLDEADIEALILICKGDAATKPEFLEMGHVRDAAASLATVKLRAIRSVQNVNALAPGESLTFDRTGITILYGDNGSGKSGYARILKRACRARLQHGDTILPNIYATPSGPPTAIIEFSVNDQNRSSSWVLDRPADPVLSAVSVFDSQTASVHVDQENAVAYTPVPLKVLAALAQACQNIKQWLTSEIKALEIQTPSVILKPTCHPGTRVGKLLAGLASAKRADVITLATLTEPEKARLTTLKADLAADPLRTGRQLQALKGKLDAAIGGAKELAAALETSNITALRSTFHRFAVARAAAQAASTTLFSQEPLPEVGSDVWRLLWEAARNYSKAAAYADRPFPVTGDEARCVLCHQLLTPEAAERLTRFETFLKDESKRLETQAQAEYTEALAAFDRARMTSADRRSVVALIETDFDNAPLAAETRRGLATLAWRQRHIRRNHAGEGPVSGMAHLPLNSLIALSSDVQGRAAALLADAASEARKKLVAERDELADREWLATIEQDVLAELDRREQIRLLQAMVKDTATNRITTKSAELAATLVTNTLRARFAKEVDRLGVAGLAIELRQERTAQGVPFFRVNLLNKPGATVGKVLSEGEHRCVALAAFLAEMATADGHSTIVFDDPISSLDHMHREAVAKRLAEEGKERQLIVFTHDIAFLFLLHESCQDIGTQVAFRSINRGAEFSGFCDPNPPQKAQPIGKVIEGMKTYLRDRQIHHERGKHDEWYRTVKSLQEQLRTTWERAVENAVAPVLRRLGNKVDTKGLAKLTVLTVEDCKVMRDAYGRCSALLHSTADSLNPPLPTPASIAVEITALSNWVADIQQRQDKVASDN